MTRGKTNTNKSADAGTNRGVDAKRWAAADALREQQKEAAKPYAVIAAANLQELGYGG